MGAFIAQRRTNSDRKRANMSQNTCIWGSNSQQDEITKSKSKPVASGERMRMKMHAYLAFDTSVDVVPDGRVDRAGRRGASVVRCGQVGERDREEIGEDRTGRRGRAGSGIRRA